MENINEIISGLEFAQIGWVVPDIGAAVKFLEASLGIKGFPPPEKVSARDLGMSYYNEVVEAEWLTTQTFNGGSFIELVQPLTGRSMFHDYLDKYPAGGTQHLAFRLPEADFDSVINELKNQGFSIVSEVEHPIARMTFFDTYHLLGVATEIMGVTPEGWKAIKQMERAN